MVMAIATDPVPGEWYENIESGQVFRVITVNEAEDTIEIQYQDGDIGELESRTWEELDLEWIEPPENWTVIYDDVEKDDLGYTDNDISPEEEADLAQRQDNEAE
jgi:hypothetical protein